MDYTIFKWTVIETTRQICASQKQAIISQASDHSPKENNIWSGKYLGAEQ
jgi:hypothetical protein